MDPIQPESRKIKKAPRKNPNLSRNFICGCARSYGSYPALYCHVKRKHCGIMPPGSKIQQKEKLSEGNDKGGRPSKLVKKIDELPDKIVRLEEYQNDLICLLAEKLERTSGMYAKSPLQAIVKKVLETNGDHKDKWMLDLKEESKRFLEEHNVNNGSIAHLDFDEEFLQLDPAKGLKVIVWFMMWLGNVYVKLEFIPEICLILSRIWKVLDEMQLTLQDLDNKLVWKKIMRECEGLMTALPTFKNDMTLLNEFIQQVCQLIGRAFEENDTL